MPTERARLLELALENLTGKKKQIEMEMEEIASELGIRGSRTAADTTAVPKRAGAARRRPRFSREERKRRSARMKAYWENWRKKKKQKAQAQK